MLVKASSILTNRRIRKNLGDLDSLSNSIAELGLLHPIVVKPNMELVAGYRRLMAIKTILGLTEIEVTIVENINDTLAELKAERDENVCRLDFSPSEAVEMGRAIEPLERVAAENRRTANLPNQTENFTVWQNGTGRALDHVAEAVGMSRPTYNKAKEIVEAATADPETYEDLLNKMDKSGKVNGAYKEKLKRDRIKELENMMPATLPDWLLMGDFREVGESIPDNSIDLIFTDPPYDEEASNLYADLAEFASRKLKPGGICMTYSGQLHLPQVYEGMGKYLEYMWLCGIGHSGGATWFRKWNINNQWKPILMYGKPPIVPYWKKFDDFISGGREKSDHKWQQALSEAEHYIRSICLPGALILDPFLGSGTSLIAARNCGMQIMGIEKDPNTAKIARKRIEDAAA